MHATYDTLVEHFQHIKRGKLEMGNPPKVRVTVSGTEPDLERGDEFNRDARLFLSGCAWADTDVHVHIAGLAIHDGRRPQIV